MRGLVALWLLVVAPGLIWAQASPQQMDSPPTALLKTAQEKTDSRFLKKHLAETESFHDLLQSLCRQRAWDQAHSSGISSCDAERRRCRRRDVFRRHRHRMHMAGAAYQGRQKPQAFRVVYLGVDGERRAQCVRSAVGISRPANHRPVRRRRLHNARARRPIDASGAKDSGGSDHPQ